MIRDGFISNSSSTSFIITNKSNRHRTLVEFVIENPQLIEKWNDKYGWGANVYSQLQLLISAHENDIIFEPHESHTCTFGDEDGTVIGRVFDYILRDGGSSENFDWDFLEFHR
jgi:hypothetical protein